ncbi:hypothetical protein D9758_004036 [Tetrapyrgos nigripes]|uniref:Uncharacterized protein n=1 Tax=Tetrapyrgos nigripes TaxID=182062 RepID=A0A8H5GLG6_9AGAR|nr:hypothetical protein D9758_004036 [Tetrapyrgos nigripes]
MASLAQSSFISHPWFNQPTMKRKQSSSPEESSDDGRNIDLSKPPSEQRAKRRKVSALERGLSHLTLNRAHHPISPIAGPSNVRGFPPADDAMDIEPDSIPPPLIPPSDPILIPSSSSSIHIQPSSIEEPDSPPTRELKMKGTSWYEPEPDREPSPSLPARVPYSSDQGRPRRPTGIVVTDLDSSDDEDFPESEQPIQVSPALLERIRQKELLQQHPVTLSLSSSALVLYRPLAIPSAASEESLEPTIAEVLEDEGLPVVQVEDDENKMDIEPI